MHLQGLDEVRKIDNEATITHIQVV